MSLCDPGESIGLASIRLFRPGIRALRDSVRRRHQCHEGYFLAEVSGSDHAKLGQTKVVLLTGQWRHVYDRGLEPSGGKSRPEATPAWGEKTRRYERFSL